MPGVRDARGAGKAHATGHKQAGPQAKAPARSGTFDRERDKAESNQRDSPSGVSTPILSPSASARNQVRGCTPKAQASNVKLTKASTVLLMMMRVTRPLSAP